LQSVISKEHPVNGGAEFPDNFLMFVTVRVRVWVRVRALTLFDEATTLFDEATILKE